MTPPSVRLLSEEPAWARDFAEAFAAAVERIRRDPRSFPLIHGQIRRLVLRRFPYAIDLREQGAEILVIAVHGRLDPRRWQQRT